ncbi:hypothetical protein [Gracilibacillus suaedae]|uniref:hypothetical protein n=1 Tax=Gracilibacillus suaedae TaxID=2820273 RepID=UPI001ABEB16C|nr:hypothetical protein [Gracilibacillus suaedae]
MLKKILQPYLFPRGVYGKIEIEKPSITLIGEGRDKTVVTYDVASGTEKMMVRHMAHLAVLVSPLENRILLRLI